MSKTPLLNSTYLNDDALVSIVAGENLAGGNGISYGSHLDSSSQAEAQEDELRRLELARSTELYKPTKIKTWQSGAYDAFTVLLFTADVVLDIMITVEFYKEGEMGFFWGSIAIFAVSQLAYSALFMHLFISDDRSMLYLMLTFILLLPFAQLAPFVIFCSSFNWRWLNLLLTCLKLDGQAIRQAPDPDKEPWEAFILSKLQTHGGFIAESIVESVPQSILQLIALVVRSRTSNQALQALSIVSVCTSILSVASRGLMVSFSLDRSTMIFCLFCFIVDVFSLFCTASWIFSPPENSIYDPVVLWPLTFENQVFSTVWIWKEAALGCVWYFVLVGMWVILVHDKLFDGVSFQDDKFCEVVVALILLFVFGHLLFAPFLLVVEVSCLQVLIARHIMSYNVLVAGLSFCRSGLCY